MSDNGKCLLNTGLLDEELKNDFEALSPDFYSFSKEYAPEESVTLPMLIRYLVFSYDRNSQVAIEHKTNWILKKKASAIRAKFPTVTINNTQKFTEESENIIFNKNKRFSEIIVGYLALQFNQDFQLYVVYSEILTNVLKELMKYNYDKPNDLKIAKQNCMDLQEDIAKLERRIFSGDDMRELKVILYETAYQSSLELRPEHLATKKENGEPLVDINPYQEGYMPEKLRFLNDQ